MSQSVVVVVADADRSAANLALAALFGDDVSSQNLTIQLSASGQAPATHWALHLWRTPDEATAIKDWPSGVLPTPAGLWEDYGLDETSALAAGETMTVSCMACSDAVLQSLPSTNLAAAISAHGLVRIV